MPRLLAVLAFAAIVGATIVACSDTRRTDFEFTPVPYTVVSRSSGTPIPIAVGEEGARYIADRVTVVVEQGNIDKFIDWADENGFEVRVTTVALPINGAALLSVGVPVGAAPDALAAIERQDIVSAQLDYLLETQNPEGE